jgi:[ribosomal protein S18]-alanine N-acetyltransferase
MERDRDLVSKLEIRLASAADAKAIALLSRTEIEHDLPWKWTPSRVSHAIADHTTNVVVAFEGNVLAAFGIMLYREDAAHLQLLAVRPGARRRGVGSAVLRWLEEVALVAGVSHLSLESREDNVPALAFYRKHGYVAGSRIVGMYQGLEDGVRLEKVIAGSLAQQAEK